MIQRFDSIDLQTSDAIAESLSQAPRVSLADIEETIGARYDLTAAQAIGGDDPGLVSLNTLSLCIVVMRNGFVVIGKSAPASSENFNAEFGRRLAYEDAIRQIWPLMGYALREKLYEQTFTEVEG